MLIKELSLPGVKLITPRVFKDDRGFFFESWSEKSFKEIGLNRYFVQDNHSLSVQKGTLRGIHFQINPKAQTKLIRCSRGRVMDVAIDLRKGSGTYCKWIAVELSASNYEQLYIPAGFGHAFLTLEDNCEVQYKVDYAYAPDCDRSILWNDQDIDIDWPIETPTLSEKDKSAVSLKQSDINFSFKENPDEQW
jgi:dTDP-4-dehydrorhamnose 3,5-epimerase